MKTYTAAVIGLSHISQARAPLPEALSAALPMPRSHVAAYAAHPRIKLVGACDLLLEPITRFEQTWRDAHPDTKIYTDYREMIARERPDIVSVVTPDDQHADIVVAVARAGVPAIWCEKPLATTLEDADRMIDAVEANKTLMLVSHTRRWIPLFHRLRELVTKRPYGALKLVSARLFYSRAMLFRNGTHAVDMLTFLAGAPAEWVIGELEDGFDHFNRYLGDGGRAVESEPSANALIRFTNGVRGSLLMQKGAIQSNAYELVFENAVVRSADDGRILVERLDGPPGTVTQAGIPVTQVLGYPEWTAEAELATVSELVDALDKGTPPPLSTPRAARATLAILLGILESHARGNAKVMINNR
ncbi:MAG: Gfo/Idh/MocA family oxidoreductase [Thermoflexales bacterium]|nr:Gfo/Idh/MocA family oxidoreductase [Thermoflexales bacterium]